ncbi:MAG: response regulator transcription factor [Verrucomicrobiota bacterium]|nr:response regulator transcription factor [Verrucomicrobiota bacterium]
MTTKVAIVEDDSGLRESLAILINGSSGLQCVATYSTAEAALKKLPLDWPDVVLMDINLPQMSGIECVAQLKLLRPSLQIIMLTVYVDNERIFKSLQAGASGYLIKQTAPAELLAAVADVQRGGAPMTNTIARRVVQYFQQRKPSKESENLTSREQEILDLIAQGYRDKEIADKLSVSVRTVGTHIRNIYEKLHVHSRTEAVLKFLNK